MFPTQEVFGKFYEENIPARDTHRHKNVNLDSRETSSIMLCLYPFVLSRENLFAGVYVWSLFCCLVLGVLCMSESFQD